MHFTRVLKKYDYIYINSIKRCLHLIFNLQSKFI